MRAAQRSMFIIDWTTVNLSLLRSLREENCYSHILFWVLSPGWISPFPRMDSTDFTVLVSLYKKSGQDMCMYACVCVLGRRKILNRTFENGGQKGFLGSRLNLSLFGCASDNHAWQMTVNPSGASNAWVWLAGCTCRRATVYVTLLLRIDMR